MMESIKELPSVILEGPDGAGKTFAASVLMERDSFAYRHEGVPPDRGDLIDFYSVVWENYPKPVVADRFIAGELAYGPTMRGSSRFTFAQAMEWLGRYGRAGKSFFHVLLLPPINICLLAWNKRNFEGKEYVTEYDLFRRVYQAYEELAERGMFDLVIRQQQTKWVDSIFDGSLKKQVEDGYWLDVYVDMTNCFRRLSA